MPLDDCEILGVDRWLKPFKFCVSVAVFLWTVAWLMPHLPAGRSLRGGIRWSLASAQIGEIGAIVMQAARGTRSHFNFDTPFDTSVFALMGVLIVINTLAVALLLYLFCARSTPSVARPYLWGIRLGILVFLLGSAAGGVMIERGSHTVGAPDGGPGLPFTNWSTEAGDLRAAHLVGCMRSRCCRSWVSSRAGEAAGALRRPLCASSSRSRRSTSWRAPYCSGAP